MMGCSAGRRAEWKVGGGRHHLWSGAATRGNGDWGGAGSGLARFPGLGQQGLKLAGGEVVKW